MRFFSWVSSSVSNQIVDVDIPLPTVEAERVIEARGRFILQGVDTVFIVAVWIEIASVNVGDPPAWPGRHPEFDSSGIQIRTSDSVPQRPTTGRHKGIVVTQPIWQERTTAPNVCGFPPRDLVRLDPADC